MLRVIPFQTYVTPPIQRKYVREECVVLFSPLKSYDSSRIYIIESWREKAVAIYKSMIGHLITVLICVSNFDDFFEKFRMFHPERMIMLKVLISTSDMESKYLLAEKKIRKKLGYEADLSHNGVEVSFRPRVFDSVASSLTNPLMYGQTEDDLSVKAMKKVASGGASVESLKEMEREVKSLIFAGLLENKNGLVRIRKW